jgi:hypothetical protein
MITYLKGLFETMNPGAAASAQPHLDALELVIGQALYGTAAASPRQPPCTHITPLRKRE